MKDNTKIGKITVKHFINIYERKKTILFNSNDIDNSDPIETIKPFPLYVKITFMRVSTQMKSIWGLSNHSMDDYESYYFAYLELEKTMISDVIRREYIKNPDGFSLKGICDICKIYEISIKEFFINEYIKKYYDQTINSIDSEFKELLKWKNGNDIAPMTYFKAAKSLIKESSSIIKLENKFKIANDFYLIMAKQELANSKLIQWAYNSSNYIPMLKAKAKDAGISYDRTEKVINAINATIHEL